VERAGYPKPGEGNERGCNRPTSLLLPLQHLLLCIDLRIDIHKTEIIKRTLSKACDMHE